MPSDIRVFYAKCRPQGADAFEIAQRYGRIFVGYPVTPKKHLALQDLLDISVPADAWSAIEKHLEAGYLRQVSLNRKFALEVQEGFLVMVPRPGQGVCHIGRVSGRFRLDRDPAWADEYIALRKKTEGLLFEPREEFIADVTQGWPVDEWRTVAFTEIPRWITYRLLSRNTIGWIDDHPDKTTTAFEAVSQLHSGHYPVDLSPTLDPSVVSQRLTEWLSPTAFEHLVCDLLQLEDHSLAWWHVGGSGDGGVDGIAMDSAGCVASVVQCKWMYQDDPIALGQRVRKQLLASAALRPATSRVLASITVHVAVLFDGRDADAGSAKDAAAPAKEIVIWNRDTIAKLLVRHRTECAMARTLGIG